MPRIRIGVLLLVVCTLSLMACSSGSGGGGNVNGGGGNGGGGNGNGNGNGNGGDGPPVAQVIELRLDPIEAVAPVGSSAQFSATAIYSDNTSEIVTADVEWSTSAPEVGELDDGSAGRVLALAAGETAVTATFEESVANAKLTVIASDIEQLTVEPEQLSLATGETLIVTATAHYPGGFAHDVTSDATWTSDDEAIAVAEFESETLRVRGVQPGSTSIRVAFDGEEQVVPVVVSDTMLLDVTVSADSASVNQGALIQLTAMATFSDSEVRDVTTQVIWSSSDEELLRLFDGGVLAGLAAGLEPGSVSARAAMGSIEGELALDVIAAPGEPRQLVLFANPNVILSDGQDSTTLSAVVTPNSPDAVVADGRIVEFASLPGNVTLSDAEQSTVSGSAEVTATAQLNGVELVIADVPGTLAAGAVWLLTVDSFSEVIFSQGRLFLPPTTDVRTLAYTVVNLSNRPFDLISIEVFEEGNPTPIGGVDGIADLVDGQLGGGAQIVVSVPEGGAFDFDVLDPANIYTVFEMRDISTQQEFSVRVDPIIE